MWADLARFSVWKSHLSQSPSHCAEDAVRSPSDTGSFPIEHKPHSLNLPLPSICQFVSLSIRPNPLQPILPRLPHTRPLPWPPETPLRRQIIVFLAWKFYKINLIKDMRSQRRIYRKVWMIKLSTFVIPIFCKTLSVCVIPNFFSLSKIDSCFFQLFLLYL